MNPTSKTSTGKVSQFFRTWLLAAFAAVCCGSLAQAQVNGTWSSTTSGGTWSTTGNWLSGNVASGGGYADFSQVNITTDPTVVHLDTSESITNLIFGDLNTNSAAGWLVDDNGSAGANTLTLSGTPSIITVNALGGGKAVTLGPVIIGSGVLIKNGNGNLVLTNGANTIAGGVTLNGGTLTLDHTGGATTILPSQALTFSGGALTINGAAVGTSAETFSGTTLNAGLNTISAVSGASGTANLTLGAFTRNAGANVQFNLPTTGTIGTGVSATSALLGYGVAANGNGASVSDFAGIENSTVNGQIVPGKTAVPASYVSNPATGSVNNSVAAIEFNVNATGGININNNAPGGGQSLLFDSSTTLSGGWLIQATGTGKTWNINQILVTSGVGTNNVFLSNFDTPGYRPENGLGLQLYQYNTSAFLTIAASLNNGGSPATAPLTISGPGTVVMAGNGYTGQTYLNGGATEIIGDSGLGAAATAANANLNGGTILGAANFTLDNGGGLNPRPIVLGNHGGGLAAISNFTMTVDGVVSGAAGTGPLVIGLSTPGGLVPGTGTGTANATAATNAIGTVVLNNTGNTYTGGTVLDSGILQLNSSSLNVLGTGGITLNGGTFQWSAVTTDISSLVVTLANGGGALDANGLTVTLANPIGNNGIGALTVKSTAANGVLNLSAANTYTGGTTVSSGTLNANNASGSATGSGNVTVASGATLGGTGTISGNVAWSSGGLALFTKGSPLTISGSIALNNNAVTVYVPGGTPLAVGNYTLATYNNTGSSGSFNATPAYTGAGVAGGTASSVSTSGGVVTLSVVSLGVSATWNVDADGTWTTGGNWSSNPNFPHSAGDGATFGIGSSLRTVNLNSSETVGSLTFTNSNSFVITNGADTLTLNNSGFTIPINVTAGTSNAIQTPVVLNGNVTATVNNGSLLISGSITNSSTETLTVGGTGTLALSGHNYYGPAAGGTTGTTLNGTTTLQVGNNNALGAGDVSVAGTSNTLQAGASVSVGNNIAIGSTTVTVDNNGDNLTLGGNITGNGLTSIGTGKLTLNGTNTYSGSTTVNAGVLSISSPSNVANTASIVLNGGDLLGNGSFAINNNIGIGLALGAVGTNALIDAASGQTFTNNGIIASAGNTGANNLSVNGIASTPGTVVLGGANTFSGTTVINAGTLQLANSLALQNSTLNYSSGSLSFGSLTAATLGGLSGSISSLNLALANTTPAAVALSVGGNNATTIYGGQLSGSGSLTKNGTGTLTISNATYAGATTVSLGYLNVIAGSFGSSSSAFNVQGTSATAQNAGATVSGGTLNAGQVNIGIGANQNGATLTITNTANATFATGVNVGAAGNTGGGLAINTSGNVSLGAMVEARDNGTPGLSIQAGTVTATSVDVQGTGGSTTANAYMIISGGSLTISGSSGAFKVGDTTGGTGHGGTLNVSGGTLTYLGTDGLLAANGGGTSLAPHGNVNITGGVTTLTGVTLNAGNFTNATSALTVSGGATLYLGSVGLVSIANGTTTTTATVGTGGATIGALANWSSSTPITLNDTATFQAADALSASHNITLTGTLLGGGSIIKTGGGTVYLLGDNNASSTTVSAGTLYISTALQSDTGGTFTVNDGTTLGVVNNVASQSALMYSLTLGSSSGSTTLVFTNVADTTTPVLYTQSGGVNLNGNNTIQIADKVNLTAGSEYPLIRYTTINTNSGSGALSLSLPSGVTGYLTNDVNDANVGNNPVIALVVTSVSTINPNPPPLITSLSGANLTLSWPTNAGWILQTQTNSLAIGLSANWVDVPGSSAVTTTNYTINPANGSVFYRLRLPP